MIRIVHKKERDRRIREWLTAEGNEERCSHDDVLAWGVYRGDDEDCRPPLAVFESEDEAHAYVAFKPDGRDAFVVLPCLVDVVTRDSTEIPE